MTPVYLQPHQQISPPWTALIEERRESRPFVRRQQGHKLQSSCARVVRCCELSLAPRIPCASLKSPSLHLQSYEHYATKRRSMRRCVCCCFMRRWRGSEGHTGHGSYAEAEGHGPRDSRLRQRRFITGVWRPSPRTGAPSSPVDVWLNYSSSIGCMGWV